VDAVRGVDRDRLGVIVGVRAARAFGFSLAIVGPPARARLPLAFESWRDRGCLREAGAIADRPTERAIITLLGLTGLHRDYRRAV
jgi:hypothetical protein